MVPEIIKLQGRKRKKWFQGGLEKQTKFEKMVKQFIDPIDKRRKQNQCGNCRSICFKKPICFKK